MFSNLWRVSTGGVDRIGGQNLRGGYQNQPQYVLSTDPAPTPMPSNKVGLAKRVLAAVSNLLTFFISLHCVLLLLLPFFSNSPSLFLCTLSNILHRFCFAIQEIDFRETKRFCFWKFWDFETKSLALVFRSQKTTNHKGTWDGFMMTCLTTMRRNSDR